MPQAAVDVGWIGGAEVLFVTALALADFVWLICLKLKLWSTCITHPDESGRVNVIALHWYFLL